MIPIEDDTMAADGPWGVYMARCLACGCAVAHVAHVDDVARGVYVGDILCSLCIVGRTTTTPPEMQA